MRRIVRYRYPAAITASVILGIVFIASGLGKLLGQNTLSISIVILPTVTPLLAEIIAAVVPWVELLLGICLVTGISIRFAASVSYVLILAFVYYNSWMLMNGLGYEPCGCFGIFEKFALGELSTLDSLYIDIGLIALALISFFAYPGGYFNLRPWFIKARQSS